MTGPSTQSGGAGDEPPLVPVSSTRTRRVVLGLAVVLVVVIGAGVGVAISTGADGEGGERPVAGTPGAGPSAASTSTPAPSGAAPGPGTPPAAVLPAPATRLPAVPPDDAFRAVPRLCEEADFSPVFDIVAQAEVLNDEELAVPTTYQRSCTFRLADAGSAGTFQVDISVYSGPDQARSWFDDVLTGETRRGVPHEELGGADWDANAVLTVTGPEQADVRFLARDQTLVLSLSTFVIGDAADEQAQQEAMVRIAAQLRERVRA